LQETACREPIHDTRISYKTNLDAGFIKRLVEADLKPHWHRTCTDNTATNGGVTMVAPGGLKAMAMVEYDGQGRDVNWILDTGRILVKTRQRGTWKARDWHWREDQKRRVSGS
jgi:hypothetical protein